MSYCFNPHCQKKENPPDAQSCLNCGKSLLLIPPPTGEFSPRYRIIKPIGEGGFGRTFLVRDETQPFLSSQCVIKQFYTQNLDNSKALELFTEEVNRLESLGKHPQIPRLLNHFSYEEQLYLVQEFIEGQNLEQELELRGQFSEEKIRKLLKELLPVLQFIHKSKVIHRDIKPANIIRRRFALNDLNLENTPLTELVLVDFGAAKLVVNPVPKTATIIGSAAYTAPEQLMGKAVFASDLYSLGITCLHLLTNVSPFDLFDSQEGTWVWRDFLKVPVSDSLGNLLDKMIEGGTKWRFRSAFAVLQQLDNSAIYLAPTINKSSQFSPPPRKNQTFVIKNKTSETLVKIEKSLEEVLELYQLKIQGSLKEHKLTIILNRQENIKVNYSQLLPLISQTLSSLNLKHIRVVKLCGRVEKAKQYEWKQILTLDPKLRFKNKLLRIQLKLQSISEFFEKIQTEEFWLEQVRTREFWIDALTLGFIGFIFSQKLIISHPLFSIPIAGFFLFVKRQFSRNERFDPRQLFVILALFFAQFGTLSRPIFMNGTLGFLIACVFVCLPLFCIKDVKK